MRLYEQVAATLVGQIDQGVYRPGDRIPGVRKVAKQLGVSIATAVAAYQQLEDQGHIEARPRSGYYVRIPRRSPPPAPSVDLPDSAPTSVSAHALGMALVKAANQPGVVQLGAAVPAPDFLPLNQMQRALAVAARRYPERMARYEFPPGAVELRRQIAKRMADAGVHPALEEILVTNGCQEALTIALRSVAGPGDIVALESPTFYGLLQVIESLGMRALEIPSDPVQGISLEALSLALEQWPVKACVVVASFSNPLGGCMPAERKRALVEMLGRKGIPLIEDDIYGELAFAPARPPAAKAYDADGNVLYCGSFSKTLSPGLRLGWMVPGRHWEKAQFIKYDTSLASATLPQLAVAEFLAGGGFDRYLRRIRGEYQRLTARVAAAVEHFFPTGTRVTQPAGGFVVWVELPAEADAMDLYRRALERGISIAPGPLFSASGKYRNCIRLNCAQPWRTELEWALQTLGRLARE